MGKTRLVSELEAEVADGGDDVVYAGTGGAALAITLVAVRRATAAAEATLVILDDLDVVGEGRRAPSRMPKTRSRIDR